ncbi:hypothetical protein SOM61_03815 [Massilia sp. CFBP9012]|uniref:hypothetical protein n=1 Tax=Massilia sp. CFBP9012 TaxID=3096531 RepID=UPI002A6B19C1|nr:hypothetical protein [Massilia sp. CFBP9012]MDY0974079.1 hypothetical protein [Massilia sp. CFBP9012]
MRFDVPAPGLAPYLALAGITLLAACLPLLLLCGKPLAARLRSAVCAAALVLPFTAGLGWSISHNTLELRDGQILVRGSYFYEYARDIGEFDLARARHGDRAALAPDGLGARRNGISLAGYAAGRFGGRSGDLIGASAGDSVGFDNRESLFVTVTEGEHMVYLPARHGQSLLVSVEEGDALLQALYRAAPAGAARVRMN